MLVRALLLLTLSASLAGCSPGGDAAPSAPDAVWLETGNAPGQTVYPRAIAYDARNDWFYLIDRQAHVQRLSADGKHLAGWSMPDYRQGKPVGITVGPDGNLYVPDTHYHRVIVYSPDGQELRRWGTQGSGDGQFIYPTDIAFDDDGRVFVAEYGDNDRVQVFTQDGTYLYQFGRFGAGPGEFSRPQSLIIIGRELYLTDACNHRIQVFSTDGTFLRTLGSVGSAPGQFRFPYGLDLTPEGHLLVTEFGNNRVQLLKTDGTPLKTWGSGGRNPGELAFPWAAAIDKRGRAVIVDSGNNRLQVVKF